ncbi:lipopolysaccharide biosynthesis protein [Psychroserpens sp.]|uniref:lipopolysaccharide biosynthesis protein n=1 Tax=Psychroserpens sp. TaxID=2020870 RepID=UPI001B036841|nr:oligosaccharide flippase family protein [Psychroserpens sp.]MBO6605710.1 oligosaccharide flippase family protein [Psychroserpens sp.]MBO6632665.1 oligosaccharide flippase family protein [Psychroserpens sp.]MBO6652919.1 oligosaccharide flippase family protein [Psychroserpens sp.]MBO6681309.1 oligosaccharide flippase family protein [Psychroserpens sp.]MBO6749084.1 oligosaccharide flippase family protein [Psychroserpens sp.]
MLRLFSKIIKEDNFLSLSGNLVIAVLGFGGFGLLARTLDPEDFAAWVLFISCGSLIEMLRYGITNNALVRFLSGASKTKKDQYIGSNMLISLIATMCISAMLITLKIGFSNVIEGSSYELFFDWYPVLAFLNLPLNNALVVQQAYMNYGRILVVKVLNSGLFFCAVLMNFVVFDLSIDQLIYIYLGINSLVSIICITKSWDGLKLITKSTKTTIKTLLNFGKYSTFTLIGTNLLRNADIWIISISPFGSAAVALFSIPLKLTEIQQIPLRSFAATAFPKMSKASMEGRTKDVRKYFNTYAGALTYLFIGMSLVTFLFAEEFVILVSGYQYLDHQLADVSITVLVKILSIYGLLLPIDRMTGIGLDSVNRPKINAFKVCVMLITNLIGDLTAVFVFESLELVAISTIIFTSMGIVLGSYFLNKEFEVSPRAIFKEGNSFYRSIWFQYRQLTKRIGTF